VTDRAAASVKVTTDQLLRQGHVWIATTKDLAKMMSRHMPSAQAVVDLHSRSHAIARDFQERLIGIKDRYHALPGNVQGTGKGSISEFLYDSTTSGKWGFDPIYQANAEVDPNGSAPCLRPPAP
jgi:hypothetical protein